MDLSQCGILFRGYAKESRDVPDVVKRLAHSISRAQAVGFAMSFVLIPIDKDCGETAHKLTYTEDVCIDGSVQIMDLPGNENCDLLNRGLHNLLHGAELQCGFIVSNKAASYLTPENVQKVLGAFGDGARTVGLAVREKDLPEAEDELFFGVLEGRLSNTFAAWDLGALDAVGNFDSEVGVEEIAPIIRLIGTHGRCVAPILPAGQESGLNVSALRAMHHARVLSTKRDRQIAEAVRAGGTFELIASGILPGYPR